MAIVEVADGLKSASAPRKEPPMNRGKLPGTSRFIQFFVIGPKA